MATDSFAVAIEQAAQTAETARAELRRVVQLWHDRLPVHLMQPIEAHLLKSLEEALSIVEGAAASAKTAAERRRMGPPEVGED
jgi:hypothetical protein